MIYFVYAGDPLGRAKNSPNTISQNIFRRIQKKSDVSFIDWKYTGPIYLRDGDVIIGHPHPNRNTVMWKVFDTRCSVKRYLMFPFSHGIPSDNLWADDLVMMSDGWLPITGPYWTETIDKSPFSHWKRRMLARLDMAIDPNDFPRTKIEWSPVGERVFFGVGDTRPAKGQDQLFDLALELDLRLVYAGVISERNLEIGKKLSYFQFLGYAPMHDRAFQKELCKKVDFFLHCGVSDANPTTILECASLGLPVICTPESGYDAHELVWMKPENLVGYMPYLSEKDDGFLSSLSSNISTFASLYTWDRFWNTMKGAINELQ